MSEYWIEADGDVNFADGDIGDVSHEGVVIDRVQRQIIDKCISNNYEVSHPDEYVDWDKFLYELGEDHLNKMIKAAPQKQEKLENKFHDDNGPFTLAALKACGINKQEWEVANQTTDARDYAMQKWRWKTYRDQNIETWFLRSDDVRAIINGINNIADEEGWGEGKEYKKQFYISVFSNKKHFTVTLRQLENWLIRPTSVSATSQDSSFNYLNSQAAKQVRDQEMQFIHPAYKRPGVNPFGDSVIYSFRDWINLNG